MLPQLDPRWQLLRSRRRGTVADLERLCIRYPAMPADYLRIAANLEEYELKHATGQYLRIWAPTACFEMDEAHRISKRIPGSIAVADDGGDRVLLYLDGPDGFGLYRVGFGALDAEEVRFVAPTLADVLSHSSGVRDDDIW